MKIQIYKYKFLLPRQPLMWALFGSRAAATSKIECFVIIVNGFQPLTIITKCSILDVTAALDPPVSGLIIST